MTNDLQSMEDRIHEKLNPETAGALIVSSNAGGLVFQNVGQMMEFAKIMSLGRVAVRKHLRNNPGACLAIIVQALEWRMSPFAVANKSYEVNDQIAYESQLIHAVILTRAPIIGGFEHEYIGEGQNLKLKIRVQRADQPGKFVEYESPMVKDILVKNSPLWKSDTPQQLHYYSARALCRRHFPHVILGVYAEDELPPSFFQGPDRAKDISPGSPLAERLAAANRSSSGFDPSFVTSETATAGNSAPADPPHNAETGEIDAEPTTTEIAADTSLGSGAQADPESQQDTASGSATNQQPVDDDTFPGDRPPTGKRKFIRDLTKED